jgi:hypothetical protein
MPEVVTITAEMRAMKPAAMEAANAAGSERAAMEAAAATEPAAMEAATAVETPATAVETPATAVETPATAVETPAIAVETPATATAVGTSATATATAVGTSASASTSAMSVGGIWLAERCNAQQSKGGGCQSPSCAGASFLFAELLHRRLLLHGPPTGHL